MNEIQFDLDTTPINLDLIVEGQEPEVGLTTDPQILVGSDKNFVHNQLLAADTWNITHNLGKYPSVTVVDSAGTVVIGEIKYIDLNSIRIMFAAEFSGKTYFN